MVSQRLDVLEELGVAVARRRAVREEEDLLAGLVARLERRAGVGDDNSTRLDVHPYDEVAWERRDARITNYRDGTVAFEQADVEVPSRSGAIAMVPSPCQCRTPDGAEPTSSLPQHLVVGGR